MFKPRRRARRHRPILHGVVFGLVSLSVFLSYHFSPSPAFHDQQASALVGLSLPSVGPAPAPHAAVLTSAALPLTVHSQSLAGATFNVPEASAQLPTAVPAPKVPFQLYSVADGDTAGAIASRYGIQLEYLLAANADLRDGELLNVGQMLIIPSSNGILYHVGYGETLSDVAAEFGVTVQDIIGWGGNGIASADQVADGQLVFVPNGNLPVAAAVAEPTGEPPISVSASVDAPPVAAAVDNSPPPAGSSSLGLSWPVTGPISSYMGPSHPLGIDIDLFSAPYSNVYAATSGTVTFAGGNPCCSYGYYVTVLSPDGVETLYAHLSSISVSTGQVVNQGDVLGVSGCTGNCTGNHLHFEVIDNGVRVNPLSYLP